MNLQGIVTNARLSIIILPFCKMKENTRDVWARKFPPLCPLSTISEFWAIIKATMTFDLLSLKPKVIVLLHIVKVDKKCQHEGCVSNGTRGKQNLKWWRQWPANYASSPYQKGLKVTLIVTLISDIWPPPNKKNYNKALPLYKGNYYTTPKIKT